MALMIFIAGFILGDVRSLFWPASKLAGQLAKTNNEGGPLPFFGLFFFFLIL